jgi:hypothetical protein
VKQAPLLAAAVAVAVAGAAMIGVGMRNADVPGPRKPAERPTLVLLTSLPLVFGESFGLESGGSAALSRLEQRYNVLPIGVADAASLNSQKLLLMAHPRAQPAEALVELDQWVRRGGRVLLLADPRLDWPSERPLGDLLRPPPAFADTGLLAHWGLRLGGPDPEGPVSRGNGKLTVFASSPGRLESRSCEIRGHGFVARCRIGRGAATIIADADLLNVDGEQALNGPTEHNLDLVIAELARLESG